MATEATLLLKIKTLGAKALSKVTITLGDIGNIAKAAGRSMFRFGEAMFDAALKASQFDEVQRSFRNLAASQGQDADEMLRNMVELSKGTVSSLELMKQANNALLLGLPVEKFGEILEIARSASKATGETMQFMLRSIVTGLGRGSKLVLDNLGIVFNVNDAYEEFATKLNKTAASLTEVERKQAFVNKALDVGKKNAEAAGGGTDSLVDSFERFKAQIDNATVALGDGLGPVLKKTLELLTGVASGIEEVFRKPDIIGQVQALDLLRRKREDLLVGARGLEQFLSKSQRLKVQQIDEEIANIQRVLDAEKEKDDQLRKLKDAKAKLDREEALAEEERIRLGFDLAAEKTETELISIEAANAVKLDKQIAFLDSELANKDSKLSRELLLDRKFTLLEKKDKDKKDKEDRVRRQKLSEFEKFLDSEKVKNAQSTFGQIASLSRSNNKALMIIGKSAAIANILINTAQGISLAFATFPFPANIALAALVGVAGAAQVATVAGVNLAEGGIVQATAGGTPAIIGEGGQDEAVIPLDDEGQGIGSNITIIVNGGMLGDEASAREFAVVVDEELMKLRRDDESISFEELF